MLVSTKVVFIISISASLLLFCKHNRPHWSWASEITSIQSNVCVHEARLSDLCCNFPVIFVKLSSRLSFTHKTVWEREFNFMCPITFLHGIYSPLPHLFASPHSIFARQTLSLFIKYTVHPLGLICVISASNLIWRQKAFLLTSWVLLLVTFLASTDCIISYCSSRIT